MSAASLEEALSALGVQCAVEGSERFAVLRESRPVSALADEMVRARVVALALAHGFTHVAVELIPMATAGERTRAVISGD